MLEGTFYFDQTKPPAVGQILEISAALPREVTGNTTVAKARLTGKITEVFAPPTEKLLRGSNSYLYKKKCRCQERACGITMTGTYKVTMCQMYQSTLLQTSLNCRELVIMVPVNNRDSFSPFFIYLLYRFLVVIHR
jgi:hypothetical protein